MWLSDTHLWWAHSDSHHSVEIVYDPHPGHHGFLVLRLHNMYSIHVHVSNETSTLHVHVNVLLLMQKINTCGILYS